MAGGDERAMRPSGVGDGGSRRVTVVYHGHVQGIGFRYTAASLARGFDVKGYVRNESDGTVTLVVEGARDQIDGFLAAIRQSVVGRYITSEDRNESTPTGEFRRFEVRYGW